MTKLLKKRMIMIATATILFASALLMPDDIKTGMMIAAYLTVGLPIIKKALRNIIKGRVFDENFLMMVATFGAFYLHEYTEATAVMLFYQIGEWFQSSAVNKSRRSIAELMNIRPDYAHVMRNKQEVTINPEEVQKGEIIVVHPGEKIPLDGVVVKGYALIDTAALTGEAMPKKAGQADEVKSGCVNLNGVLEIKVTEVYGCSTVAKILDLVENASSQKARIENFITRFATYYTPTVVILALILAIVPPLIYGANNFGEWIYRAITFLVISCPCALVISVPLSFFGGLGASSKIGVLIKGGNYLEGLARTEIAVFDKTGTLTQGGFKLTKIYAENGNQDELLEMAAYAEIYSKHPIAESIKKAYAKELQRENAGKTEEIHGCGVRTIVKGKDIYVGNAELMQRIKLKLAKVQESGTVLYVAEGGIYKGYLVICDEVRTDAELTIKALKQLGIKKTVMLTGDVRINAEKVAKAIGVDEIYAELLPTDKVQKVEELMQEKSRNGTLMFVGDGINDAPVLARADIGVAMGGIGSDAAIEAADVVIMTDEPAKLVKAIDIARRTLHIARQNVIFAIGIKIGVLGAGAIGFASIWAAIFADVGVSIIAILNAMRCLWLHKRS